MEYEIVYGQKSDGSLTRQENKTDKSYNQKASLELVGTSNFNNNSNEKNSNLDFTPLGMRKDYLRQISNKEKELIIKKQERVIEKNRNFNDDYNQNDDNNDYIEESKRTIKKLITSSKDPIPPKLKVIEMINSNNPIDYLEIAERVMILQTIDQTTYFNGCESPIRHMVEMITYLGETMGLFHTEETTNCCQKKMIR